MSGLATTARVRACFSGLTAGEAMATAGFTASRHVSVGCVAAVCVCKQDKNRAEAAGEAKRRR
jgi:hypothetical protein